MMKSTFKLFLLIILLTSNIQQGYSSNNKALVLLEDSIPSDTVLLLEHNDTVLSQSDRRVIVTDTLNGHSYEISDSLAFDMLLSDTLSSDSITSNIIPADTVIIESDSIYTDSICVDSLKKDSVNLGMIKKDSICIKKKKVKNVLPKSVKELRAIYSQYRTNSLRDQDRWDDIYLSLSDIEMKPVFYKYVIPLTYYSKPFIESCSIDSWYPEDILTKDSVVKEKRLLNGMPRVDQELQIDKKINRQLLNFYVKYPELVRCNESRIDSLEVIHFDEMSYSQKSSDIISFVQNNAGIGQVEETDLLVIKPNFWNYGGNGYLQFSQNYISDNWYKGGESTNSLLSGFMWQIKYDDKQKMQYEGKFEWKLGFITAPSDTVHSYKANNDLLRLSSKLGYKAIWNWYYTLSAEFQTQLMSNYATNSDDLISAFFSPATLNVGVGMDYKLIRDGVINLSVLLNPFNYTMYSVASDEVDPTKFNIKEGRKKEHELGSRINTTLTWKMFPFLLWESKFSYTTNYEKVFSEWENTFTFVINKYLSTKLFVHARYDDSVKPKKGEGYFQLQELFSFGLNYTW